MPAQQSTKEGHTIGLEVAELKGAKSTDVLKAFALSAVGSYVGAKAACKYINADTGTKEAPKVPSADELATADATRKLASTLGPAVVKFAAIQAGAIKGNNADLVKNSIVLDLAMAYGLYIMPKVMASAYGEKVTFPRNEGFARRNVASEIAALQAQAGALNRPYQPRSEGVVGSAIADASASRSMEVIG